jgi:hypothetical protein
MCADDPVEDPHGIFRGCFDVILADGPKGLRFTVEQCVRDPERTVLRRGYNCFNVIRGSGSKTKLTEHEDEV